MMKLAVPLAWAFAASTALACPDGAKQSDAKADFSPSVNAALSTKTPQTKPGTAPKMVKPAEAKKPTT